MVFQATYANMASLPNVTGNPQWNDRRQLTFKLKFDRICQTGKSLSLFCSLSSPTISSTGNAALYPNILKLIHILCEVCTPTSRTLCQRNVSGGVISSKWPVSCSTILVVRLGHWKSPCYRLCESTLGPPLSLLILISEYQVFNIISARFGRSSGYTTSVTLLLIATIARFGWKILLCISNSNSHDVPRE